MNKSILVIDTPESCEHCPLELDVGVDDGGIILGINICRGCAKTNRKSDIKPDWCPLRSVPEKMEVCGRYPQPDGIVPSYKIGWNECVDKILKIGEVQDESKITGCNEI